MHSVCTGDWTRGRTHIMIKYVEHVPDARRAHDHFQISQCGPYKIMDIEPKL
jgi:hypothetical protein